MSVGRGLVALGALTLACGSAACGSVGGSSPSVPSPTTTSSLALHAEGPNLADGSGRLVRLHGAQIESAFNYIKRWQGGENPADSLDSTLFGVMAGEWKMNAVRIPISNWIYASDPVNYLGQLDRVVAAANGTGLYVVLDLHDDAQSGSPYGKTPEGKEAADYPKTESVEFWTLVASHFKANRMVLFDLFNEPKTTSWEIWLHGGPTPDVGPVPAVGFQDLVTAIRSTGANQLVVVEPGTAGESLGEKGWASIGPNLIQDPNLIYSAHVYGGVVLPPPTLDAYWGPILGQKPIYYGEWAVLPNAYYPSHCKGITPANANQIATAFMDYMDARGANWTAWSFTPVHLVLDWVTFTPTTLDGPWTCGDTKSKAGMGALVKQRLQSYPR